jgi:hypothetical protein
VEAVKRFETLPFKPQDARARANEFTREVFVKQYSEFLAECLAKKL